MLQKTTLAIDIMGGDNDPHAAVSAICEALEKYHGVSFLLFGDKSSISSSHLFRLNSSGNAQIIHTKDCVKPTDKPALSIRNKASSSLGMAISAVKNKQADACVSSGNTGAFMALAKNILNVIDGIKRPAICGFVPSGLGPFVALDLGANVDATPEIMLQFAIMGNAFYTCNFNGAKPKFALLNVGSEEGKGSTLIKDSYQLMKESNAGGDFIGYIEGDVVQSRGADVIVSDGFTGNIWLKGLEGLSKVMGQRIKRIFSSTLAGKLSYLALKDEIKSSMKDFEAKRYNGAMFVGLDGICVKSHGGSDAEGFSSAINIAVALTRSGVNDKIKLLTQKTLAENGNSKAPLDEKPLSVRKN